MSDVKDKLGRLFAAHQKAQVKAEEQAAVQRDEVATFFDTTVRDAFTEFQEAIEAQGRTVQASVGADRAIFSTKFNDKDEYRLEIKRGGRIGAEVKRYMIHTDTRGLTGVHSDFKDSSPRSLQEVTTEDITNLMLKDYEHTLVVHAKLGR
jgi:hypothetical protein